MTIDQKNLGWVGSGLMAGGKGYVTTPLGQAHYRLVGEGATLPLLLLHQTPWSIAQYAEIQNGLAAEGVQSLAVDTPGYGMSDPPPFQPSIGDYADNLLHILDALNIERVVVAGHHTGATIAAHFAARNAARAGGIVLHGFPLFDEAERASNLAKAPYTRPVTADGSHLTDVFRRIYSVTEDTPRNQITTTWSVLNFFLSGSADNAYPAVFSHDSAPDLAAIDVPILLLSDDRDGLHAFDLRASEHRRDATFERFSTGSAHGPINEPERWAARIAQFARSCTEANPS